MVGFRTDEGREQFAQRLRAVTVACEGCGFADAVLGGAWRARVRRSPSSGHVVYDLTCPDCGTTTDVEVNLS